jgi:hypothetical protein
MDLDSKLSGFIPLFCFYLDIYSKNSYEPNSNQSYKP